MKESVVVGFEDTIIVKIEESLDHISEAQINSELILLARLIQRKIFYEKKKINDLWPHFHWYCTPDSPETYRARLGEKDIQSPKWLSKESFINP